MQKLQQRLPYAVVKLGIKYVFMVGIVLFLLPLSHPHYLITRSLRIARA